MINSSFFSDIYADKKDEAISFGLFPRDVFQKYL